MDTGTLAVALIFGGPLIAIAMIIGGVIYSSGRSKLSRLEAQGIRQRLEGLEERMDLLTKAVVGSPIITEKDASEIAQEAARIQAAQAQQQRT